VGAILMNCKQVQELLPLYVGRDLEEKRERKVTAHVHSCAECAGAADEYRETRQLLQDFAPPPFSEDVYVGIRGRVLREIEAESTASSLPELVAVWFRPRLTWAVASAALIAFTLLAFYFIANRRSDQLAGKDAVEQPARNEKGGSQRDTRAAPPPSSHGGDQPQLAGIRQPGQRKSRGVLTPGVKSVAANSSDGKSTVANVSPQTNYSVELSVFPARDSAASGKILRVEIQTKDPNIRIIWFTSPETKPAVPNSKGI
jgi:hypothetical protein